MAYTKDEMTNIRRTFFQDTTLAEGVYRWKSNGAIPPADVLECVADLIAEPVLAECERVRDQETQAFLAEYRRTKKAPGREELAEMRAAFGTGTEVVNVITGRRIRP